MNLTETQIANDLRNIATAEYAGWRNIHRVTKAERNILLNEHEYVAKNALVGYEPAGWLQLVHDYCDDPRHIQALLHQLSIGDKLKFTTKLCFVLKAPKPKYLWEASASELVDAYLRLQLENKLPKQS